MHEKNKLCFDDNLKIIGEYVQDASVDRVHPDSPFSSSVTYMLPVAPLCERRRRWSHLPAAGRGRPYSSTRRVQGNPRKRAPQAGRSDAGSMSAAGI
jgi:hypothetical protein